MVKTSGKIMVIMCFVALLIIGNKKVEAKAETMRESEPNNTIETSNIITRNDETAYGAANGTYDGQSVVYGYSSKDDIDFYKVYLYQGINYMTCNDHDFEYEITGKDGILIQKGIYKDLNIFGPTAYKVDIPRTDYYYIKVNGCSSKSESYLFLIGSPTYSVNNYSVKCTEGTVSMTQSNGNKIVHFDLTSVEDIPKDAIVYSVSMSGIRTTAVKSIKLKNEKDKKEILLEKYVWNKKALIAMEMPAVSNWSAILEYNKNISFIPILRVDYAYPVYNTMIQ